MEIDMAFRWFPMAGVALAMLVTPALAQQQPACGDRNDLLTQLKEKYKETPTGFGMTGQGSVVELMTSESGSWTLILSFPSGRSCLIATGEGWEMWQARLAGRGA
jgi:hypothetical protein